jgi:hypothetical protein
VRFEWAKASIYRIPWAALGPLGPLPNDHFGALDALNGTLNGPLLTH